MAKIQFVKSKRPSKKANVLNPFAYGSKEYWNRRENFEKFLSYTSDRIYWMWINEELDDQAALQMAEIESGQNFDPKIEYSNGGEVEQKIKDKLAKGAFELPMELIVYVPSTKQGNQIIPKSELQQRVKSVKTYLSSLFGGFSAAPIDGGYVSEDKNKGLIEEDAVKVTAFATKEALESNMDALLAKVKKWCAQWSQESIGLEFEGDLFYVSKTAKFNGGGQTEEEENRAMILSQAKEVAHHVSELNEIMTKQPDIDAWVIAKMQDVTTGLSDITHYLDGRVGFRLGADDVSERMKEMLRDGGKTKFMKGGVAGDIYSLENPEQFKQLITIYNNLSEKTDLIKGYYLDHTDNSIVFLTAPNISDIGKDKIFGYVEFLKKQDFSIINWKKTIDHNKYKNYGLNWGTEKGSMILQRGREGRANPQWFKLYLIDRIKYKAGGEIILGGGSMASVQDSILAKGAKLKSGKLTLSQLKSMIEEYNSQGRNFELLGAYNQLELWSNDHRIEAGSKQDIYRALVRYRYNPKYSDGAELPDLDSMTDEEIITFANTLSYYDRMDEGIEEEFDNVEDAKEYLRMMAESE
jgi:hypothetical protein